MRTFVACAVFAVLVRPAGASAQVVLSEAEVLAQLGHGNLRVQAVRAEVAVARADIPTRHVQSRGGRRNRRRHGIGRRVEEILLAEPEVVATARRTGRAEYDEHVQGVEAAEIDVGVRDTGRPRAELLTALRRGFATLPGTNMTIGQPISHRTDHMLSGTRASIAVKIFGDDLLILRRLGEHVRDVVTKVPGAVDVSLEQQMDVPFVRFVLNRPAIARYGLRTDDVAEAIETGLAGAAVVECSTVAWRSTWS